ncbi:MAG: hypothetical protein IPK16_24165 [Anaerolineales bacterium]|nr:hypothetical protein [Anaerolineales bacterium]
MIILLLARAAEWIPVVGGWVGWLVLIVTWMFSTGAIILHMRRPVTAPAPAPVMAEIAPG